MDFAEAIYLDGESSHEKSVVLYIESGAISFAVEGATVTWFLSSTQIEKEYDAGSRRGVFSNRKFPDARLIVFSPESYAFVVGQLKRKHAFTIPFTIKSLSLLLLICAAFLTGGFYLVRYESRTLAPLLPMKLQARLVDEIEKETERNLSVCVREKKPLVKKIIGQIARDNGLKSPRVILSGDKEPNAFALPGNAVLVYQGLLASVQTEAELSGVFAHELGHLYYYHPQQGLLQTLGLGIFTALTVGATDINALSNLALTFHNMQYSQAKEQEADQIAQEFMRKSGIDPSGLAEFFKRLKKEETDLQIPLMEYLSTHPTLDSRVKIFSQSRDWKIKRILSDGEWAVLKEPCGKAKALK